MCSPKAQLRDVNLFDLVELGAMAEAYANETQGMKNHPIDYPKLMRGLALATADDTQYLRLLVVDGKLAGAMWGTLYSMPWSATLITQDLLYYVYPQFRGYGGRLISDWVRWSEKSGAKECALSTASGIATDRTTRYFQRVGFSLVGLSFIKEL